MRADGNGVGGASALTTQFPQLHVPLQGRTLTYSLTYLLTNLHPFELQDNCAEMQNKLQENNTQLKNKNTQIKLMEEQLQEKEIRINTAAAKARTEEQAAVQVERDMMIMDRNARYVELLVTTITT